MKMCDLDCASCKLLLQNVQDAKGLALGWNEVVKSIVDDFIEECDTEDVFEDHEEDEKVIHLTFQKVKALMLLGLWARMLVNSIPESIEPTMPDDMGRMLDRQNGAGQNN